MGANEISAKATIANSAFFLHRGLGCVVHDNAVIGEHCTIGQNVTIGSKWPNGICDGSCPIIGCGVFIGAGAVILGNIKIGDYSVIGANAVVTKDVPPYAICVGVPGRIVASCIIQSVKSK